MREGFTSNYVKGGVLFAKASRGGRALKEIKEKGGVLGIIALLLPPPRDQNRGEGGRRPAPAIRRRGGLAAARSRGKRGGGMWGIDSPAHLGSGRSEEAGQREQAAAALAACGGGAVSCEERRWWPGRLGCGGAAPVGAFYSRGEAVARPGVGDGRRAARSAINGVLALCERRGAGHGRRGGLS